MAEEEDTISDLSKGHHTRNDSLHNPSSVYGYGPVKSVAINH
jgi:hypothetical protein